MKQKLKGEFGERATLLVKPYFNLRRDQQRSEPLLVASR